jgi:hypothetical protein
VLLNPSQSPACASVCYTAAAAVGLAIPVHLDGSVAAAVLPVGGAVCVNTAAVLAAVGSGEETDSGELIGDGLQAAVVAVSVTDTEAL